MIIVKTQEALKEQLSTVKGTIGLVPTMGYLHDGHLSLVRKSIRENDFTVVSIFVNPLQFGPNEDFQSYPRDVSKDKHILEKENISLLFVPKPEELSHRNQQTQITNVRFSKAYCGVSRENFFNGVLTIVNKFFYLIKPTRAYFGEKDFQQLFLIKKMVEEMNMDIEILSVPTFRNQNGLALSSRNFYLSEEDRSKACLIYRSMLAAQMSLTAGMLNSVRDVIKFIKHEFHNIPECKIDYITIINELTLEEEISLTKHSRILSAVYYKDIRLIDNLKLLI